MIHRQRVAQSLGVLLMVSLSAGAQTDQRPLQCCIDAGKPGGPDLVRVQSNLPRPPIDPNTTTGRVYHIGGQSITTFFYAFWLFYQEQAGREDPSENDVVIVSGEVLDQVKYAESVQALEQTAKTDCDLAAKKMFRELKCNQRGRFTIGGSGLAVGDLSQTTLQLGLGRFTVYWRIEGVIDPVRCCLDTDQCDSGKENRSVYTCWIDFTLYDYYDFDSYKRANPLGWTGTDFHTLGMWSTTHGDTVNQCCEEKTDEFLASIAVNAGAVDPGQAGTVTVQGFDNKGKPFALAGATITGLAAVMPDGSSEPAAAIAGNTATFNYTAARPRKDGSYAIVVRITTDAASGRLTGTANGTVTVNNVGPRIESVDPGSASAEPDENLEIKGAVVQVVDDNADSRNPGEVSAGNLTLSHPEGLDTTPRFNRADGVTRESFDPGSGTYSFKFSRSGKVKKPHKHGTFPATVTISDDNGQSADGTIGLEVEDVAPELLDSEVNPQFVHAEDPGPIVVTVRVGDDNGADDIESVVVDATAAGGARYRWRGQLRETGRGEDYIDFEAPAFPPTPAVGRHDIPIIMRDEKNTTNDSDFLNVGNAAPEIIGSGTIRGPDLEDLGATANLAPPEKFCPGDPFRAGVIAEDPEGDRMAATATIVETGATAEMRQTGPKVFIADMFAPGVAGEYTLRMEVREAGNPARLRPGQTVEYKLTVEECPDKKAIIALLDPRVVLVDVVALNPEGDLFTPEGVERLGPVLSREQPPAAGGKLADLAVRMSDAPDPVDASATVSYTITVSNAGPDKAAAPQLTNTLPAGLAPLSETTSSGTCLRLGSVIRCDLADLAANASATVVITAQVGKDPSPSMMNRVEVRSATVDPNTGNNVATTETASARPRPKSADVLVALRATTDRVNPGQAFAYLIQLQNAGPDAADGVTVTASLPAGISVTGTKPAQGTCTIAGTVQCEMGSIAPNASLEVRIESVAGDLPRNVTNTVTVSATTPDPNPRNNAAQLTMTITAPVIEQCAQGIKPGNYTGDRGCGSDGTVKVSCSGTHEVILDDGYRMVCDGQGNCGRNNTINGQANHACQLFVEGAQVCVSCSELNSAGQPTGRSCNECLTRNP